MVRLLLVLTIINLLAIHTIAQQLVFNIYTPKDGLTDARVQKIFQDSRGVLFFLTRDGFCSFDGQRFQNYTEYKNQPLSIINDIVEQKKDKLLISSISGFFWLENNVLLKDTTSFQSIKEPSNLIALQKDIIVFNNLDPFLFNKEKITPIKYINNKGEFKNLSFEKGIVVSNWLIGILPKNNLKTNELVLYDRLQQKITANLVSNQSLDCRKYQDIILIKESGKWKALDTNELHKGKLLLKEPVFNIPTNSELLFVDKQGNYWFKKSDDCIFTHLAFTKKTKIYTSANNLPKGITGMFQDVESNYWFIVQGKGVYKLVQNKVEELTPAGSIQNMHQQRDGIIYLQGNKVPYKLTDEKNLSFYKNNNTNVLEIIKRKNNWLYFFNNGVVTNDKGVKLTFTDNPKQKQMISRHITFDQKNRIITAGEFLNVFEENALTTSIRLPYFTDNIVCDDANQYWSFARDGKITQYRLLENQLVEQLKYFDNSYSTRYAICWNKDTFCLGTRSHGIIFAKINTNGYQKLFTINTNAGLSNNFISGLLKVNRNQLLSATVVGLDMLHFYSADTSVEQLFSRAGLFTGVTILLKKDDSTSIALTDEGASYIVHLPTYIHNKNTISCFFNKITVNGTTINPTLQKVFSYTQNNFRFSVSAPSFIDEKNTRFLFKVNGKKQNIVQNSTSGDFELSNLEPGNYDLEVTVLLPGASTNDTSIFYSFKIEKPFWKKLGFIVGFSICIALLLFFIFKNILNTKLKRQKIEMEKNEAIAKERTRIATDMHDDLGAGISTIKYLSQSAPFISTAIQKENNLKIAAQADSLVDKMNDIIWAMNEKNDTLDNLIFYTKSWVANYAQEHQLQTTFTLPENVPSTVLRGEKRQHIFLIVKESVHNIIKHAAAKNIDIKFEIKQKHLLIMIKDDGKGFDLTKIVSGNGIANIRKRIEALEGKMNIKNKEGTKIEFTIPL